ncbi:ROK family protein [Faecalicatena orotica]|uniref:Putative NBD/HSP70 family sugar kinase n=1 Tax=Faecalicatena orotica TaxID=1544 RepID=A0A2Y9BHQ0_9FIRM|nr:ROK family protein [Faecalicatena orotica]PWJ30211.1 putative NBD/HSP70 family sugar kinase [Faecalicatena orotica]SSA55200.1 Sugar kinase of the NBD/HSP70 family, may contain an N-terminal HTH domain [Faecalicatena orotica]
MKNYLVFDAGGTFTKYAMMDENAIILEKDKVPTPAYENHTKEDFYQILNSVVEKYRSRISGIAVSMPGMLDNKTGYCVTAGYLPYLCGSSVAVELSKRYGMPVSVENDGKCAALAEYWKGSLKDCTNGAVVVLGSGVAGGIILNGRIYRGNRFTAGEYSYICTKDDLPQEMDSYWGISGGAQGLARAVAKYTGVDWESYDGISIFSMANEGDELVLKGLKDYTDALAVQIYNLNILLDLDIIAIGGGISQQPLLLEYVNKSMTELTGKIPLRSVSPYVPVPRITNCRYYNDANLIGALYHYRNIYNS